jgi:hypothetical protein
VWMFIVFLLCATKTISIVIHCSPLQTYTDSEKIKESCV